MRTITGTDFCRVEHHGNTIAHAGAAGYWVECAVADASSVTMHRQNILDATRQLAALLGYDLVLRQPATVEEAA